MNAAVMLGLGALFALLLAGVPIGFAMGIVGVVGFALHTGWSPAFSMLAQVAVDTSISYGFSVLPMFLLLGNIIARSNLADELYTAAHAFVRHRRGGLAHATIAACAMFSAVCGSTVATAATMARIAIPPMRQRGYPDQLSAATVAAGGTLGSLIPPSVAMVIYCLLTENDISMMFAAGVLPGLLGAAGYMVAVAYSARRAGMPAADDSPLPWRQRLASLRRVWGVLLLFTIIMGGIYGGLFTATEAAGAGATAAIVVVLLRRSLSLRAFAEVLMDTGRTTAMLFFVLIGALVLTQFFNIAGLPQALGALVYGLALPPLAVLSAILVIYLVLGCVLDSMAMLLLTVPIFYPLLMRLGIDPIWFGILMIVALEVGLISPPFGMNIFVVRAAFADIRLSTIFRGIGPFIVCDIVRLAVLVAVPAITLALPRLAGWQR